MNARDYNPALMTGAIVPAANEPLVRGAAGSPTGVTGITGATGPTGPTGPAKP